jgi:hypothetical protein
MPDFMVPASVNQSGGLTSMPHPHSPGGPWTTLPDETKNNYGTSNSFLQVQKVGGGSELNSGESYVPCPGGFKIR